MIDNLIKQKANITERKNEFLSSAMEQETPMEVIQNQLELYNEQIETIDKQISELTTQQLQKDTEETNQTTYKPKTEQEAENHKLTTITNLSMSLDEMKQLDSIKTKVEGEMNCLQSEFELDKMNSNGLGLDLIAKKDDELSELQKRSEKLSSEINQQITDTLDEIKENNKQPVIDTNTPEKEEEKEQDENQSFRPYI